MKIRIIGSCGSGKSTTAKQLSKKYGIPCFEVDNMIWDRSEDNLKFPEEVRDATLASILRLDSWIIEGVQYKEWTLSSIEQEDLVFILDPNVYIRDYRIIKRFILSRTGIRPWNYTQSFSNLYKMLVHWNHRYDYRSAFEVVHDCGKQPYLAKSRKDIEKQIERCLTAN